MILSFGDLGNVRDNQSSVLLLLFHKIAHMDVKIVTFCFVEPFKTLRNQVRHVQPPLVCFSAIIPHRFSGLGEALQREMSMRNERNRGEMCKTAKEKPGGPGNRQIGS